MKTLTEWIHSGRFPHAIMIEGQPGSGRKTYARLLASAILCGEEQPPCGQCSHCSKIEKDIHPDVITAQGEGRARSFSIDTVRKIRSDAFVRPNEADGKVFLLLETQEMGQEAQNALLKILEEPPVGVYFILVCENRQQMLPTIRSRTTTIAMEIPEVEETAQLLAQRVESHTFEDYQRAAIQADGNVGRALELLADEQAWERYQQARDIFIALLEGRELDALALFVDCQRDRPLFLERLTLMRSFAMAMLLDKERGPRFSALQLRQIIDIIDKVYQAAEANVSLLLLITLVCAEIRTVLSRR